MAITIKSMMVEYDGEDALEARELIGRGRPPYLNNPSRSELEVASVRRTKSGRLLVNLRRKRALPEGGAQ